MELCTLLEYAVHSASAQIFHKAQQEPEKRGMGTTVVALLVIGQRGFIAYVGDSRIYLSRNGVVYPADRGPQPDERADPQRQGPRRRVREQPLRQL
jgi:serine/threonine protein phosphatase PrpC